MAVSTQKFLVNIDLRGNKLIGAVLGTTAGTANGAIWFDETAGLVKFVDATGAVQSVSPVSYVDATAATINQSIATHVADLTALISAEEARALAAEAALSSSITAETSARTSADTTLQNNIDAEAASRVSGDDALLTSLNAEIARATVAETTLQNNIDATNAEIVELVTDLANETTARTAADTTLSNRVSAVEADLAALDTSFATDASVQAVASDLAAETSRATSAENALQASITAEAAARELADANIQSAIDAEVTRATGVESLLRTDLTQAGVDAAAAVAAEQTRAEAAELALDGRVSDLEDLSTTLATSSQLNAAIDAEVTRSNAYADAAALAAETNAKAHADLIAQGLSAKESVRTVVTLAGGQTTSGTGTFYSKYNLEASGWVLDTNDMGVELAVGDHVIVVEPEGAISGGIYTVQSGAWTLRADWANDASKEGSFVFVNEGIFGGTAWAAVDFNAWDPTATTSLWSFQQMTGLANIYSEDQSITINGGIVSVNMPKLVELHGAARKVAATIGDGTATTFTINHDLGIDVVVSVRDIATGELVLAGVTCTSTGVSLEFAAAPTAGAYRVVIIG